MIPTQNRTDLHTTEHPKHLWHTIRRACCSRAVLMRRQVVHSATDPHTPRTGAGRPRQLPADEHRDTSISEEDLDHRKLYNMGDIAMDTQELERDRQQKYQRMRVTCECLKQRHRNGKFVMSAVWSSLVLLKGCRTDIINTPSDKKQSPWRTFRFVNTNLRIDILKPLNTFALHPLPRPNSNLHFHHRGTQPLTLLSFFPFWRPYHSCPPLFLFSFFPTTPSLLHFLFYFDTRITHI